MFNFNLKKLLTDVRDLVAAKNTALNVARAKRDHLRTSIPPKADFIDYHERLLDRLAANYDTLLQFSIDRLAGDPLNFEKTHGIGILAISPPGGAPSLQSFEAAVAALFHDDIKTALRNRIEALPWPTDVGPRIADRPALIEKAESEIAALEKDLADLRREASESGISI
jgi:hypothetical protein